MDLLKSKVRPMYFKYLVAASGSALVASIFGMVDAMMVGKYHGPSGNAALAIFAPLWSLIFSLGLLAGIGGSVIFANKRGSGDEKEAQEHFTLSILYGAALSILAMLIIDQLQTVIFKLIQILTVMHPQFGYTVWNSPQLLKQPLACLVGRLDSDSVFCLA